MSMFRKRPVVVEARLSTGTPESNREIIDWARGSSTPAYMDDRADSFDTPTWRCLSINTLEGAHWVSPGDWVICGVAGEFYPIKDDIFKMTYEPVGAPAPDTKEGTS